MFLELVTRSGNIFADIGVLRRVGVDSDNWTSRAHTVKTTVYYLHIDQFNSIPSYTYGRWLGFVMRCFAG